MFIASSFPGVLVDIIRSDLINLELKIGGKKFCLTAKVHLDHEVLQSLLHWQSDFLVNWNEVLKQPWIRLDEIDDLSV